MGARKQQSQARRLTKEQGMPCTDGMSLQDSTPLPRPAFSPLWVLYTDGPFHCLAFRALPETYQGVDGFGPILGLHSTQGAVGQAVR